MNIIELKLVLAIQVLIQFYSYEITCIQCIGFLKQDHDHVFNEQPFLASMFLITDKLRKLNSIYTKLIMYEMLQNTIIFNIKAIIVSKLT